MKAAEYNLYIEQGVDWSQTFKAKDGLGVEINLTGYTIAGKIRSTANSPTVVATFICTIEDQTAPATLGAFTLSLTNTVTSGIPVDISDSAKVKLTKFAYDVEVTKPDLSKFRILNGIVEVSPEVTY